MQQRTLIFTLFRTTGITVALFISCASNGMDVLELQIRECDALVKELVKKRNAQALQFREKPDQNGTLETPITSYDDKIKKLLSQRKIFAAQLQEITEQSKKTEKKQQCLLRLREALDQHTKHATILEQVIDVLKKQDVTNKPEKAKQVAALITEKTEDLSECNQIRAAIENQITTLTQKGAH